MRNFYHILVGFTIMFTIAYLCNFNTYTLEGKLIGVPILSVILGSLIGFWWEMYQIEFQSSWKIDVNDIIRTAIGFLLGGLVGTFFIY